MTVRRVAERTKQVGLGASYRRLVEFNAYAVVTCEIKKGCVYSTVTRTVTVDIPVREPISVGRYHRLCTTVSTVKKYSSTQYSVVP